MIIHTMAEGISLARKLENDSASFYTAGAGEYTQHAQALQAFARENKKFVSQIEQTYYGVITDAIEGCFALDLQTDRYAPDTALQTGTDLAAFISQAVQIENSIISYYLEASEQSKALMTDVARCFALVAKKKKARLGQLAEISG